MNNKNHAKNILHWLQKKWRWILIITPLLIPVIFSIRLSLQPHEQGLNFENFIMPATFFVTVYLILLVWILPKIYVKSLQSMLLLNDGQYDFDQEKEKLKLEDDVRKTLAQIIGGVVFLFGLIFTYNTFALNREGQITDRFTKAVEQLGNRDIAVRLGGLYALERIALDSPKDHWTIVEITSAYIREKSRNKKELNISEEKKPEQKNRPMGVKIENEVIKIDVQAALTLIKRRRTWQDPNPSRIDLNNANLKGADLENINFESARLNDTDLSHTHFSTAKFNFANLKNADLSFADLRGANFYTADLEGANLSGADLYATDLTYEQLANAIIDENTKLPEHLKSKRQELLINSGTKLKKEPVKSKLIKTP